MPVPYVPDQIWSSSYSCFLLSFLFIYMSLVYLYVYWVVRTSPAVLARPMMLKTNNGDLTHSLESCDPEQHPQAGGYWFHGIYLKSCCVEKDPLSSNLETAVLGIPQCFQLYNHIRCVPETGGVWSPAAATACSQPAQCVYLFEGWLWWVCGFHVASTGTCSIVKWQVKEGWVLVLVIVPIMCPARYATCTGTMEGSDIEWMKLSSLGSVKCLSVYTKQLTKRAHPAPIWRMHRKLRVDWQCLGGI